MKRRLTLLGAAAVLAVAMMPGAAGATPTGDDGEHKVTICHVVEGTNLYVVVTVDEAAFDGEGDNDHTQHVSKDGTRTDILYDGGECGGYGG